MLRCRPACFGLLLLLAAACSDGNMTTERVHSGGGEYAISDGAHVRTPEFYFCAIQFLLSSVPQYMCVSAREENHRLAESSAAEAQESGTRERLPRGERVSGR